MRILRTSSAFRAHLAVLGVGLGLAFGGACSSDDAGSAEASSAGAAGEVGTAGALAQAGSGAEGGALGGDGGRSASAGAAGLASGTEAGNAGMAAGGASSADAGCRVVLSMNTSNAVDAATPLTETCRATIFEGQINFEAVQGVLPDGRGLNIDFFAEPVAGASVKLEDGYDYGAHQGAAASYTDSVGVWNADSGTVSIASVTGDTYVVKLVDVHFAVLPGQPVEPATTGDFVANGTITATATTP